MAPIVVGSCPSILVLEMITFGRFTAFVMICLAVLFGGLSLILFLLFLLTGSPEPVSINLGPNEVLWWDTVLCIAFFLQHSGRVRKSFRQRLASYLPAEYQGVVYAIASGIALLVLMVLWQKSTSYFSITGVSNIQFIFYGLIMVLIMLFEPLGLYGFWIRTKIYWRTWPF